MRERLQRVDAQRRIDVARPRQNRLEHAARLTHASANPEEQPCEHENETELPLDGRPSRGTIRRPRGRCRSRPGCGRTRRLCPRCWQRARARRRRPGHPPRSERKCSAWRRRNSSDSPDSSSRSAAYSRIVSSIQKRSPSRTRTRLLSTSDCERVEICVADRLRRLERAAAREDGEPREEPLLVLVEQLVAPLDRRAQRLLARVDAAAGLEQVEPSARAARASCSGERTRTRAAASSSASGRFSSRAQSSGTASLATKLGSAARARATKSSVPSSGSSGGTGYACSPGTRSSSRLVTSRCEVGAGREQLGESGGCVDDVLEVVEQEQQATCRRGARRDRPWRRAPAPPSPGRARGRAAAPAAPRRPVGVALRSLGGGLQPEPRLARPARPRQGEQARRPPAARTTSASSCSRPRNGVAGIGRFVR